MIHLTVEEVNVLLILIEQRFGRGYSSNPAMAKLQAKLSIYAEAAAREGRHSDPIELEERRPVGPKV